jgi:TonB family protein
MYLDARAAWNRKDTAAASAQFAALVQLIDSAAPAGGEGDSSAEKSQPMLTELRLLASGFLDLGRALSASPVADGVQLKAPAREPVTTTAPEITPAVPVRQDLPAWVPTDQASRREFRGAIRVSISETGHVTSAELTAPIHPAYDRQLLLAARAWTYQPALKNGVASASEKVIEVVLKPR